jgi:tetratricopeptide (TPR) repeat protein
LIAGSSRSSWGPASGNDEERRTLALTSATGRGWNSETICRALAFAALLAVTSAFAASQSDYDDCMQNADQDRRIAGCTRVIDDVGESNRNRRIAYDNRGTAWHAKGDNDRAIADYSEAIKLNPKDAVAYDNRGTAWRDKGDRNRAIADYNVAVKLDPSDAPAYNNRGNVWHEKGDNGRAVADYSEAIRVDPKYATAYANRALAWRERGDDNRAVADYTAAIELDPENAAGYRARGYIYFEMGNFSAAAEDLLRANNLGDDPYTMLWRFLALGRLAQDGAAELGAKAVWLKAEDWPTPVIDFYLGRRTVEAMRAAARRPAQNCEAEFYGGEWHLLRGEVHDAKTSLQAAARACAKASKEYAAATAELKRLKP